MCRTTTVSARYSDNIVAEVPLVACRIQMRSWIWRVAPLHIMNLQKRVHLVGSLPLPSAAAVFDTVVRHLAHHVSRIPDGETGERRTPFPMRKSLLELLQNTQGIMPKGVWKTPDISWPLYGLVPGASAQNIKLSSLGFAAAAIAAYADFTHLRAAGRILSGMKLQVCLPTPFMFEVIFTEPQSLHDLWPVYERAMLRELAEIEVSIPHHDLSIQWDMSPEFHEVLERRNLAVADIVSRDQLVAAVARITDAVPNSVETGWHFCYGDTGRYDEWCETHHVVEPRDVGIMVAFANDVSAMVKRPVNWLHIPVPRERDDSSYFAPLAKLSLNPNTQLFLGLVHMYDGLQGAKRRIAAAKTFYPSFGIGTECGMGRRPPASIPALLDLHREISHHL